MANRDTLVNSSGIDYNRLINKEAYKNFDGLIKCKICFNILINPHDCEKCGNTFCYDCINTLLVNKKKCLYKCENFSIKPSSLAITSFLSSLKFHCKNKDSGCSQILSYLQVIHHDQECSFSYSTCPNVKCNKAVKRQTLEFHIRKECEYSQFKCDNCQNDFNRNDYVEHVENCKIVSSVFDLKEPIIDTNVNSYEDINMKSLSLQNFMKMILFQLGKTNLEFSKKFEYISGEINGIKESINKYNSTNLLFIENVNNELEIMNERILLLEGNVSTTGDVKKILEENMKEAYMLRESILSKDKPDSKENSVTSSNNSISNSKNNSTIFNSNPVNNPLNNHVNNQNNMNNSNNPNNPSVFKKLAENNKESNIRKINIRMTTKPGDKSPIKDRSPMRNKERSPNPPANTYNVETESFHNRTNNITLLKTMVKNQEHILENLTKLHAKVEASEQNIENDLKKNYDNMKQYIYTDVVDEIKSFHLQTSFDISERIIKKFEDTHI